MERLPSTAEHILDIYDASKTS